MTSLIQRLLLCATAGAYLPAAAIAADIQLIDRPHQDAQGIQISGTIDAEDVGKFMEIAAPLKTTTVLLTDSPGGSSEAAFSMGRIIRARKYATAVEGECFSACADIWLAGTPRMRGANAKIGLHSAAARNPETNERKPSAGGNAITGAYLKELGLPDAFIAYAVSASIDDLNYLDNSAIEHFGIAVIDLEQGARRTKAQAYDWHNEALLKRWGKTPDIAEAIRLYKLAAEANFAGSQNNLGDMYETGTGVPKATALAVYWYTRAAERGEPTAYLSLSSLLPELGQDKDTLVQAAKFAILASRKLPDGKNRSNAEVNRVGLEKRLAAEDYAQAVALAYHWVPLYREPRLMGDTPAPK